LLEVVNDPELDQPIKEGAGLVVDEEQQQMVGPG
jgi:hypothetical protein